MVINPLQRACVADIFQSLLRGVVVAWLTQALALRRLFSRPKRGGVAYGALWIR